MRVILILLLILISTDLSANDDNVTFYYSGSHGTLKQIGYRVTSYDDGLFLEAIAGKWKKDDFDSGIGEVQLGYKKRLTSRLNLEGSVGWYSERFREKVSHEEEANTQYPITTMLNLSAPIGIMNVKVGFKYLGHNASIPEHRLFGTRTFFVIGIQINISKMSK